jgi:hypothetical protein
MHNVPILILGKMTRSMTLIYGFTINNKYLNTGGLVHFFIFNFCNHVSDSTSLYFASTQEDQYLLPGKDFK